MMALSPISQQPIVALAALAQVPLIEIAAYLLAGRIIKYVILATAARKSPAMLMKLPFIKSELSHVKIKKN